MDSRIKILSKKPKWFMHSFCKFVALEIQVVVPYAPNCVQQFSHHRDNSLHRLFASGDELVIKGFDLGLVTNTH